MLVEVYGDSAPSDKTCREWFRRFKSGDFDMKNKERSGRPRALKTKNCRYWWMKTHIKRKNNLQKR